MFDQDIASIFLEMAKAKTQQKLTELQLKQLEKLSALLKSEHIADFFGIGRSTFYRILNSQSEAMVRYKKGRAGMKQKLANAFMRQIDPEVKAYYPAAVIFGMKTQFGWRETGVTDDDDSEDVTGLVIVAKDPRKGKKSAAGNA